MDVVCGKGASVCGRGYGVCERGYGVCVCVCVCVCVVRVWERVWYMDGEWMWCVVRV